MKNFLLLIFLVPHIAVSQIFELKNYGIDEGLPHQTIHGVFEDKLGYLWMATHGGGIVRYDGREFKFYASKEGMEGATAHTVLMFYDESIWVSHDYGLSKFNGRTFTHFLHPDSTSQARKVSRVYSIADSIHFIGGDGKIGTVNKDSIYSWGHDYFPGYRIVRMYPHKSDEVYLYMRPSRIVRHSAEGFAEINLPDESIRVDYFSSYKSDLIVSTDAGHFIVKDNKLVPFRIGLKGIVLHYDERKEIFWTCDYQNRVLYKAYFYQGELIHEIVQTDITVQHIISDIEGNTWIATLDQGFKKYFAPHFVKLNNADNYKVNSLVEDSEGRLWIGTAGEGIKLLDKEGKLIKQFKFDNLFQNTITAMRLSAEGKLWAGTQRGVALIDTQKLQVEQWMFDELGRNRHHITSIDFDTLGRIWISTNYHGVIGLDGDREVRYTINEKLSGNETYGVIYDEKRDVIYVASAFGVDIITDENASVINIPLIKSKGVTSIFKSHDDLLLMGTPGWGFVVYHLSGKRWKVIDVGSGLSSNFIYFITQDEKGAYWVGTDKGINRIELGPNLELLRVKQYTAASGLKSVETSFNAFHFSKKNKWIGMTDGLYRLNREDFDERSGFQPHFTNLELFYGSISPDSYAEGTSGFFNLPVNPSFPSDKNHLTFSYNYVNKSDPQSIRFSYILSGYEKLWSIPSQNNRVTYSNLPPGNYVFKVIAHDAWGNVEGKEIAYPFSIHQPFYQTAFFQIISSILLIGLVLLIFYLRTRAKMNRALELESIRQQESSKIRKEVARDFHDEVGNQLARIINHVGVLRLKLNGSFDKNDLLLKVEQSAKNLHRGTKDFIWSIDPESDDLLNAFLYIRDLGTKIFNENTINYKTYNELNHSYRLPDGYGREIIMIFKEAMTNTCKHAEADTVILFLRVSQKEYVIELSDNGKGFNLGNTLIGSRGIHNMYARAKKIGSQLDIRNTGGTTISLLIQESQIKKNDERKKKDINY